MMKLLKMIYLNSISRLSPPFVDEYFYKRLQKIHIINKKEGRKYSIRDVDADADNDPNNKQ